MSNTTYNGWTNYPTWRVNLEILGDYDLAECFEDRPTLETVTNWCQEIVEEILMGQASGHALDYANAFLAEVNWREIAQHLLHDSTFPGDSE